MITIFKSLFDRDTPFIIGIDKAIERIKSGKNKELIKLIRSGSIELKNQLPVYLFAGEFKFRKSSGLIKHSGFAVIDYDNIPSNEYDKIFNKIKNIPFIYTAFRSPSGNGIKAVIKIPPEPENHTNYLRSFFKAYPCEYLDQSGIDIARACFESFDPEIYVNENAVVFDKLDHELPQHSYESLSDVILPLTDKFEIINRIMKWWQQKYGFVAGQRNNNLFILAATFNNFGIDYDTAKSYIIGNVCDFSNGFTVSEAETTIKSAYKSTPHGVRFFEDKKKIDEIKSDIKNGKDFVKKKHAVDDCVIEQIESSLAGEEFWKLKTNKNKVVKIEIDTLKYKTFLENNGFKKFYPFGSIYPMFVRIVENKVYKISGEMIKDFVLTYLMDKNETEVWKYLSLYATLFSENFLTMLETVDIKPLNDSSKEVFIPYKNGVVKITANNIELIDYIDIPYYIWANNILERDFKVTAKTDNEFKTFVKNISGNTSEPFEAAIGYLVSRHKSKSLNKAIIFSDEIISDNPEGGTGKGIILQAISKIRSTVILDGKKFDDTRQFSYQLLDLSTNILVFDDVQKSFDFEGKFSIITEGITIEKKNQQAIKLSVENSPKVVITTNYPIKGLGNSHERRKHELELTHYYNGTNTPRDEFKREMFDDWEDEDWHAFDNYICKCVQIYLQKGLLKQTTANAEMRLFIAKTDYSFYEYTKDYTFETNQRLEVSEEFDKFVKAYPDYKKLRQKTFLKWCEVYASKNNYIFETGSSNGLRWFGFFTSKLYSDMTKNNFNDDVPF